VPWLKLLHITAVIVWCGALLYLPAALAAAASSAALATPAHAAGSQRYFAPPALRLVYTGVATPAALLAVATGTVIIVLHGPWPAWLIAKLAVVGLLVLGHGALGMLILRTERGQHRAVRSASWVVGAGALAALTAIAWLVLRKPG
jgi:uncharacterized membrane protein